MKVLLILIFSITFVYSSIGRITGIKGEVYIYRDATQIKADVGSKVELKDKIVTMAQSKALVLFKDKTSITVGKDSTFEIEKFVLDTKEYDKSEAEFKFGTGIFRTITGKIGKLNRKKFKIKTSMATIGIRGSVGTTISTPDETKHITHKGGFVMKDNKTNQIIVISSGYTGVSTPLGVSVDVTKASDLAEAADVSGDDADMKIEEDSTESDENDEQTQEDSTESDENDEQTQEDSTESDENDEQTQDESTDTKKQEIQKDDKEEPKEQEVKLETDKNKEEVVVSKIDDDEVSTIELSSGMDEDIEIDADIVKNDVQNVSESFAVAEVSEQLSIVEDVKDVVEEKVNETEKDTSENEIEEIINDIEQVEHESVPSPDESIPSISTDIDDITTEIMGSDKYNGVDILEYGYIVDELGNKVNTYLNGIITDPLIIDQYIANQNTASYSGSVAALVSDTSGNVVSSTGDLNINIDFGQQTIDGTINVTQNNWQANINSGTVNRDGFSSTDITGSVNGVSDVTGTITNGKFYGGATAQSIGADLELQSQSAGSVSGVIGGSQQ